MKWPWENISFYIQVCYYPYRGVACSNWTNRQAWTGKRPIPTLAMWKVWLPTFIASCPEISECSTGLWGSLQRIILFMSGVIIVFTTFITMPGVPTMQSIICGRSAMELSVPSIHFLKTIHRKNWSVSAGTTRMKKTLPKLPCIVKNYGCCELFICSNWLNDTVIFHFWHVRMLWMKSTAWKRLLSMKW